MTRCTKCRNQIIGKPTQTKTQEDLCWNCRMEDEPKTYDELFIQELNQKNQEQPIFA